MKFGDIPGDQRKNSRGDIPTPLAQRDGIGSVGFSRFRPTGIFAVDVAAIVFNPSSPDMTQLFQGACKVLSDSKEHPGVRVLAGLLALGSASQSVSDISNRLNGKPRAWIFGDIPGLPQREQFLALYNSPWYLPSLPMIKNITPPSAPKRRKTALSPRYSKKRPRRGVSQTPRRS
jgi:hypothetical protein